MEASNLFHTLVKLVNSGDITNEKLRAVELPLEFKKQHLSLHLKNCFLKLMIATLEKKTTQPKDLNNKKTHFWEKL